VAKVKASPAVVRVEILNHNKPIKQEAYSWTCALADPSPGTVQITGVQTDAYLEIQAQNRSRTSKTDGTVTLEVLSHNKPSMQATYPVRCQS
jgi:hypothetical protein